jgi:transposase
LGSLAGMWWVVSTNAVMDTNGSGRRRNRSWPEALKREIVAASFAPGASVSLVARRYDVNTNQLFSWRKLYRDGLLGSGGPALVPVTVAAGPVAGPDPAGVRDMIEIEVPGGYRVRVGSGVDGKALRRVLYVLTQR